MFFTEKKFKSLSEHSQNKKAAECLRELYLNPENTALWNTYLNICRWLGRSSPTCFSLKELSNLYHEHLELAHQHHKEHHLLPNITSNDRQSPILPLLDIIIYLDHIRSAHNVGSIIRTTEAFQLGKVQFSSQTPFLTNKKVRNSAMGSQNWIQGEINDTLEPNKPILVLETARSAKNLFTYKFPESFILVLGNEEYGVSDSLLSKATDLITIPLAGRKNSLNVACAYAIAAYEISKQLR